MDRSSPPMIIIAMCLAALAGFVDALALTTFGGFFASFMSGNSIRLGVGLGIADGSVVAIAIGLLFSFTAGVILATVIGRARPADQGSLIMAAVTVMLLLAALLATFAPGALVLLLLAAAMGCENGVFFRDGKMPFGLTYMTGSLVRMGQKLAEALMGDSDRWGWMPYLALWTAFLSGVVFGASSHLRWGWYALWLAPFVSAILMLALRRYPVTAWRG